MGLTLAFTIAVFLLFLFGGIARKHNIREAASSLSRVMMLLGIFVLESSEVPSFLGLSFSAIALAIFVARAIVRRRVSPPCVRVKVKESRASIILGAGIFLSLAFLFFVMDVPPGVSSEPLVKIWLGAFLILLLCQRSEICGNGVWFSGPLIEWNDFKSFHLVMENGKVVIELEYSEEALRWSLRSSETVRLVVPPENLDAAKQLLEANLTDITPPAAGA